MTEEQYEHLNAGVLHAKWQDLGIVPMQRKNRMDLNPCEAAYADAERIQGEVAVLLASGALPALPDGHEYALAFDGLHVRAVSQEVYLV